MKLMIIYTTSEHLSNMIEKKPCKAALAFTRYVIISENDTKARAQLSKGLRCSELVDGGGWESGGLGQVSRGGRKGHGESSGSTLASLRTTWLAVMGKACTL